MPIDAHGTTFTFGGETVGGIESFDFVAGEDRAPVHRPLNGPAEARPTQPDYGRCVLNLYRDQSDAGQQKIKSNRGSLQSEDCILTYKDGTTEQFKAFCISFPFTGSKSGPEAVGRSVVILRITGDLT